MTDHPAGTIISNDIEIPVTVSDLSGSWQAEYMGRRLSSETRDKLKASLDRLTKKEKVSVEIPVIRVSLPDRNTAFGNGRITVTRGVLTGLHAGTGNVLAAWTVRGQVQREQITSWGRNEKIYVGGDTTDEELQAYGELVAESLRLKRAIAEWERRHEVKPKEVVERAIEARLGDRD